MANLKRFQGRLTTLLLVARQWLMVVIMQQEVLLLEGSPGNNRFNIDSRVHILGS